MEPLLIDTLALRPFLNRRVSELSGGFLRLAALAATLCVEPSWLVLDEPFSAIDILKQMVATRLVAELNAKLLVFALPEAEGETPHLGCNRVLKLSGGRLL